LITPWIATSMFALLGVSIAPRGPTRWLILALVIGYALPHLLILAEPRFHLALVPVLLPFAAWGWLEQRRVITMFSEPERARRAWLVTGGLAILLSLWIWGFAMNWAKLLAVLGPGGNHLGLSY
jgi:hypothetical protein